MAPLRDHADVGVTVLEVGTYDRRVGTVVGWLTGRQFETLKTATRVGSYGVPPEASLAVVAADLGVAELTASELLRRAEAPVMPRPVETAAASPRAE